ncbi:MAG: phosphoribosylformylglycinamidine synthase [Bacteroidales bacterium]|nr:phosphoribosylformylglycinamidine synthase [Bacteroidales bacterium]
MLLFFEGRPNVVIVVETNQKPTAPDLEKLTWLLGNALWIDKECIEMSFIGPRREMITPWSTNAVEITQNTGLVGIVRMEEFRRVLTQTPEFDPMLQAFYPRLDQTIFSIDRQPDAVKSVTDIASYNQQEGLALSPDEIAYLEEVAARIGRPLTDSEVFGFSQVNSEHCRHKIFNGTFVINGKEMPDTLFTLIKRTSKENPNTIVSAYKDNVAFLLGPRVSQFAPDSQNKADFFSLTPFESVISLKAETHNFPTTVEPFNGASTGSGGEIRDRMAGGKGSMPLAGTAVYMTSYPRLEKGRMWEESVMPRPWLYQSPKEILIKASNGASDFGNKFGQPLICGSLLTFEQTASNRTYGYDKVIMLAGGIGYGKHTDSLKADPEPGDVVVVLGGDNYRIGMGGGAVSSVATGEYGNAIELNAVQRANPEMQKRVYNAIRAMAESNDNPIISVHDHGAGGHLNSLSELVESTGGEIEIDQLPIGDPTLSAREIIGNESQERMGLVIKEKHLNLLKEVAERERAPFYAVGRTTGNHQFTFVNRKTGEKPIDLQLADMFGKPPRTVMNDHEIVTPFPQLTWDETKLHDYLDMVLQLESVACKDWLTNKVDRSVTGRVALQQTTGPVQLPLNNLGIMALDFNSTHGIATSVGHAPVASLVDEKAGARLAVTRALSNIVWTPLANGLQSVSLSANWMWPCRNEGEDARLYHAVKALSDFVIDLGINVPTGKDSLSMTQKYNDGTTVMSPGTVIVSAAAHTNDFTKAVKPALIANPDTTIVYVPLGIEGFRLAGSALAQVLGTPGLHVPDAAPASYLRKVFAAVQQMISSGMVVAGHDVSAGGLITTLLEMCFPHQRLGMKIRLGEFGETDMVKMLFSESPALVIQVTNEIEATNFLLNEGVKYTVLGVPYPTDELVVEFRGIETIFDISTLRDVWFKTSYLFDKIQAGTEQALKRFVNYHQQPLTFRFPHSFDGTFASMGLDPHRTERSGIKAAIIREKGVNGDREMAWMLHLAGFDVKDVHMTDLINKREDLSDVNLIVFVGGFSNSDVLGSAKGWAGAFRYNENARLALKRFYARKDTLSLGVCNGCQLMMELELITTEHRAHPFMDHNESGKFESAFLTVEIPQNHSVMLGSLSGSRLGVWVAHGEGRFRLPNLEADYNIAMKYGYNEYPGSPNGSDYNVAALYSSNGRHLAMMPHLERSFYPWHWGYYPADRQSDAVTPWMEAFVNARRWIVKNAVIKK